MTRAWLEVEAKARVKDPAQAVARLSELGRPAGEIDYHDTYYVPPGVEGFSFHRFRVRRSQGKTIITAKERLVSAGEEANREHEFEVSDAERFEGFVRMFGFQVMMEKRKRGRRWQIEASSESPCQAPAMVEVVEIEGLGHFVEVEILVAEEGEVPAARERVRDLFHQLGMGEEKLETKPYTLMLYEKQRNAWQKR